MWRRWWWNKIEVCICAHRENIINDGISTFGKMVTRRRKRVSQVVWRVRERTWAVPAPHCQCRQKGELPDSTSECGRLLSSPSRSTSSAYPKNNWVSVQCKMCKVHRCWAVQMEVSVSSSLSYWQYWQWSGVYFIGELCLVVRDNLWNMKGVHLFTSKFRSITYFFLCSVGMGV